MSAIGLLLVLVGATLVVAEAHVPSHGALGTAAAVALAAGIGLLVSGAGLGAARRRSARRSPPRCSRSRSSLLIARKGLATRRIARARRRRGAGRPARRGAGGARAGRPRVRGRRAVARPPVGPRGRAGRCSPATPS